MATQQQHHARQTAQQAAQQQQQAQRQSHEQILSTKYESKVLPDGQLALPPEKAKAMKLKKGDKISIILTKGELFK